MKPLYRTILCIACCVLLPMFANGQGSVRQMTWDGQSRRYLCITPSNMPTVHSMPVLVYLHGLHDSIDRYSSTPFIQQFANHYGWMVVVPEALPYVASMGGFSFDMGRTWNAHMTINVMGFPLEIQNEVDDPGFLLAMMDSVRNAFNVDNDSVFLTGMSMGGFMTHRMAIEHGDCFAAFAAVSGLITLPYADTPPVCPVRMMHIHGTDDAIVTDQGYFNVIPALGNLQVGLSAEETVEYWVNHNNCDATPTVDSLPDRTDDGLRFVRHTYANSDNKHEVQFLQVIGGDHAWYSDERYYDVDYLTEIHAFFTGSHATYSGIESPETTALSCFPNPAVDQVVVESSRPTTLTLYNSVGKQVGKTALNEGRNTLSVAHLPAGFYMGRTTDGTTVKIVKQ